MITPENIVRHELIGLRVRISESPDSEMLGVDGRVVNETRNTITVETDGKEKDIAKEHTTFSFKLPQSEMWVKVRGSLLVARPEDRIKKKQEKW